MEFSNNVRASEQADFLYAKWYAGLPDEQKARFFLSAFEMVADQIRKEAKANNEFCTEADVLLRFVEITQQDDYSAETLQFIRDKFAEQSEKEWQRRFTHMRLALNWSYNDISRFIGAKKGTSVKASINRKLPAFAKLAVCVFEKLTANGCKPMD